MSALLTRIQGEISATIADPTPARLMRVAASAFGLYAASILLRLATARRAVLPFDRIEQMARERYGGAANASAQGGAGDSARHPMQGRIAIVTGSTSGIGEQVAEQLFRLGATVIVASRSIDKCVASANRIRAAHPSSPGVLKTFALDTSDLESVAKFVAWFTKEHSELHVLINNAGIVYLPSDERPSPEHPRRSKQGYDMAFATNYLGHFLLTEELLPLLQRTPKSRIVFVASTSYLQVDGQDMMPQGVEQAGNPMADAPLAARSDVYTGAHAMSAYANSKLSQMLHMAELEKRLLKEQGLNAPKVVSICPGFVDTGLVPKGPVGRFIGKLFYPADAAILAPLHAALAPDSEFSGTCNFLTNFYNFWCASIVGTVIYEIFSLIRLRSLFVGLIGVPWVIAAQHITYGVHRTPCMRVVGDEALTSSFYAWSRRAVQPFAKAQSAKAQGKK